MNLKSAKISQILTQNHSFQGHLLTFESQNTPKSRPFEAKKLSPNTSQTSPKQLWKSPEIDFFDPQNGQNTGVNMAKSVDFWVHFRSTNFIFGLLVLKKKN